MEGLRRSNKITAYWEGDGVAIGIFYKTHEKIETIRSNDEAVISAGFVMPGTEENPVSASIKLESFKNFMAINASSFGIMYDPIDRRSDEFKFPGKYTEETVGDYAKKMLEMSIEKTITSVQTNVIDKMVKAENLAEGASLAYAYGDPNVIVTELYTTGSIKYAVVEFPVVLDVLGKTLNTDVTVEVVSGQIKKPRNLGNTVMTMNGMKGLLIENGILPKIEKKVKEDEEMVDLEVESDGEIQ